MTEFEIGYTLMTLSYVVGCGCIMLIMLGVLK
jgi:hypothetical protein